MADTPKLRVVILGGGTAGWMTAAALTGIAGDAVDVQLVEAEDIGIVGVGEATLPHLRAFIQRLGIAEADFMAATHATYKLGIEFHDFGHRGERYIHPFGSFGGSMGGIGFIHHWLRARAADPKERLGDYSLAVQAAEARRFAPPNLRESDPVESFGYAYQFDATCFAPFLRRYAIDRGATRIEGRVVDVARDAESGDVSSLLLADGARLSGDLFVDCSGFRAALIGGEEWEDWSRWLPCDRAVAAPCSSPEGPIEPFTRAVAMPHGWRWRIPLRHRVGNGYVFSSAHTSEQSATDAMVAALELPPVAEPRVLRFTAGRRRRSWARNVVAIGLSSGFLEPLESTSIHLVQVAITALLENLPTRRVDDVDRTAFNRTIDYEYDRIRDFLILHYHATCRDDTPFWNHVRTMAIPDSLAGKLALWRSCALVPQYRHGLFLEPSWIAVLVGQGQVPTGWDPRAELAPFASLRTALAGLRRRIAMRVDGFPSHDTSLAP